MTADPSARLTRLNAEYARALDDYRLEDWPAFFTDPCLYSITSADNHRQGLPAGLMYADSRGMLQDRVAALREANIYERQSYRHLMGLPAILGDKDGVNKMIEPEYPAAADIKCTPEKPTTASGADIGDGNRGQCCDPLGMSMQLPACNAYRLVQDYVAVAAEISDTLAGEVKQKCVQ